MTLVQVVNAYNGYYERENERTKALQIITWETTRWHAWVLFNIYVDKKYRIKDIRKLLSLDWDAKIEPPTMEEMEKINKMFPDIQRNGNK
jgi:hypothetical protein